MVGPGKPLRIRGGLWSKPAKSADPVVIHLPTPPSVNNMFSTGSHGKRFVSRQYESWRTTAKAALIEQRPRRFTGQVEISITIQEPKRRSDIDNRCKGVLDLLVAHQIIPTDDNTCLRKLSAEWGGDRACRVEIREAA